MTNRDELIAKAKAFGEANRIEGGDGWAMMADFAISIINSKEFLDLQSVFAYEAGQRESDELVAAERKRIAKSLRNLYNAPHNVPQPTQGFIEKLEAK